jgi:hypothetical protein
MKKILVITPRFPIPTSGACEQDRLEGVKQLKRLGYDVQVISKVFHFQNQQPIVDFSKESTIPIHLIPYRYAKKMEIYKKFFYILKRVVWPPFWDGSVYEYSDPVLKKKMEEVLKDWKPEIVWFDYTFMLPLYPLARRYGCKIVTHSLIYDPNNLLEEEGGSFVNYIRAKIKTCTEYVSVKKSDYVFAITPDENNLYKKLGAKKIQTLPLRALYNVIGKNNNIRDKEVLNVFFMGSTYNVKHNLQAVKFVIEQVAPMAGLKYSGRFNFFVTGGKLPEGLQKKCIGNIKYVGFVDDLNAFLEDMDIALIPSLSGAGMQQKIFEPIARGFPTIVSERGLAGYPFECGKDILCAKTTEEFISGLGEFLDVNRRKEVTSKAVEKSKLLFSREKSDNIVLEAL